MSVAVATIPGMRRLLRLLVKVAVFVAACYALITWGVPWWMQVGAPAFVDWYMRLMR